MSLLNDSRFNIVPSLYEALHYELGKVIWRSGCNFRT